MTEEERYDDGLARLDVAKYVQGELRRALRPLFLDPSEPARDEKFRTSIVQAAKEVLSDLQLRLQIKLAPEPVAVTIGTGGVVEISFMHKVGG